METDMGCKNVVKKKTTKKTKKHTHKKQQSPKDAYTASLERNNRKSVR